MILNGLPWKRTEIILSFLRLHPSTAFQTLLLTTMATPFLLRDSCPHPFLRYILSSVTQSCPTLCNPMDCSVPGFPVHHQLSELVQTQVCQVSDAIQPSHPLSASSAPALDALGLTLDDRGALILSTNSSGHFTRLIYTTQEDFVHSHLSRFGVYSTSFRRTDSVFPSLPICCCFSLVTKSSPTLYDPLDCSTPGIPVIYNLPESGRRE